MNQEFGLLSTSEKAGPTCNPQDLKALQLVLLPSTINTSRFSCSSAHVESSSSKQASAVNLFVVSGCDDASTIRSAEADIEAPAKERCRHHPQKPVSHQAKTPRIKRGYVYRWVMLNPNMDNRNTHLCEVTQKLHSYLSNANLPSYLIRSLLNSKEFYLVCLFRIEWECWIKPAD